MDPLRGGAPRARAEVWQFRSGAQVSGRRTCSEERLTATTKHEDRAMTSRSVVIAEPVRTAIGAFGGTLKDMSAPDLGAVAIRAAVERAGLRPDDIETVAMGSVIQAANKMNPARRAAVQAGLRVTVPAMTVNR